MKKVYIAHPLRGHLETNLESAARWVRWAAVEQGVVPLAPYIEYCAALDDESPEERKLGMKLDVIWLELCDEMWICGSLEGARESAGIRKEVAICERLGIPVHTKATEGGWPPGWEEAA